MFIIWGRKVVYRKLGYVAHFCPMCREPRPFALRRVGSAGHLYYISVGQGDLVGYERICLDCGTALQADPDEFASFARQPLPLPELTRQTFPHLEQVLAERLALEKQVRSNPGALTADVRHVLIRHPFLLLAARFDTHFAKTRIDKGIGLALAATLGMVIFGPELVTAVAPGADLGMALLVILALGFGVIVWQVMAARPRYVRKDLLPLLARSLQPLQPNQAELQAVIDELAAARYKLAKRMKGAELHTYLAGRAA